MLARMMRSHIGCTSLLVGLSLMTLSCGTSTPALGVTSPTPVPSPSPTATISPTATATSVANAACGPDFSTPPGPLPTTMPLPPGTLVYKIGLGIMAGSVGYNLCTPATSPAAITAFMDPPLPAPGSLRNSVRACNLPPHPWYKGKYGAAIFVDVDPSMPDVWFLGSCPHVGGN